MTTDEKMRHANQIDIFNPMEYGDKRIFVVGAGGIGSITIECLAKIGFHDITVVDFDDVENHNIASQNYWPSQKWMKKVDALRDNVLFKSGIEIKTIDGMYDPSQAEGMDVVIMAVDNMDVRKQIAETAKPKYGIIDGRMSWRSFLLYTFNPRYQLEKYIESWFPQSEWDFEKCTAKSVAFNTYAIAGVLSALVSDIVQDKPTSFLKIVDLTNYMMQ